jgi:KaiC/GvpD/RAD55 family RecA-like ATPase
MSNAVRLPAELTRFLNLPGPRSLLIRGPPGSGKTTLSLALLEAFPGQRVYVSGRVRRDGVVEGFPWLGDPKDRGIELVDATQMEHPIQSSFQAVRRARQVLIDTAQTTRELEDFLWLPSPIQEAWSRLDPRRPSMVVIDSWNSLVERYLATPPHPHAVGEGPDRAEVERLLLSRMARCTTHLVLVVEEEAASHLDYLVDGIGVTRRETFEQRLERWLQIPKLRGIRVDNASYPFTLEGAQFTAITPTPSQFRLERLGYDPEPDRVPGALWPGSRAFADAFGRLPLRRLTLLEYDASLSDFVRLILAVPILSSVLAQGGRALALLPPSVLPEDFHALLAEEFRPSVLANGFRMVSFASPDRPSPELAPLLLDVAPPEEHPGDPDMPFPSAHDFFSAGGGTTGPLLLESSVEGLRDYALRLGLEVSPGRLPALVQSFLRSGNFYAVFAGHAGDPFLAALRPLAGLDVRIHDRAGRPILYGERPHTPGFALVQGGQNSHPVKPYDLLRIV